ncbi:hypothetical protein L596_025324 [Steinernema carpocapsae]|uniref:Protein kinase domain-containing protein n=1 Tax=Steinernema carpocapsae TaxID=34508 RepID=A0A4U5M7G3_STECR|nr:hypothetical protein L596_025324 [Steinernema carpocapsae]
MLPLSSESAKTSQRPSARTPKRKSPSQSQDRRSGSCVSSDAATSPMKTSGKSIKSNKEATVLTEDVLDELVKYSWYHGLMPREEVEDLLTKKRRLRSPQNGCPEARVSGGFGILRRPRPAHRHQGRQWEVVHPGPRLRQRWRARHSTCGEKMGRPEGRRPPRQRHSSSRLLHPARTREAGTETRMWKLWGCLQRNNEDPQRRTSGRCREDPQGNHGQERIKFVKEASLSRRFNHTNIVQMLGIASQQEPIMIILELAPNGSLKGFLQKNSNLEWKTLTKFVIDAAEGMNYLSSQHVIHRDIAARNCLLGSCNEVKISDFGLSVAVEGTKDQIKESRLKAVPIRWLSPETLSSGVFSTKSDVWSFGIMTWEIFHYCKSDPYPGKTNAEVKSMIVTDQRMKPPQGTPVPVADTMQACWLEKPDDRPDSRSSSRSSTTSTIRRRSTLSKGYGSLDVDECETSHLTGNVSKRESFHCWTTKQNSAQKRFTTFRKLTFRHPKPLFLVTQGYLL